MSSSNLPEKPSAMTPAMTPATSAPAQTPAPNQTSSASPSPSSEGTVRLNGRDYTLAELESLTQTAKKIIESDAARSQTPAQVNPATPTQSPTTQNQLKNPLEAPTSTPAKLKFDDLSEEGQFIYNLTYKTVDDIVALTGIVQELMGHVANLSAQINEHEIVNGLRIAGVSNADVAMVRALRAQGITDPLKAIPTIMAMTGQTPTQPQTTPPVPEAAQSPGPEGAGGGASTSFVYDPAKMSANEAAKRIARGEEMVPVTSA
jgi:hypothetical protein